MFLSSICYSQDWESMLYPYLKTNLKNVQPPNTINDALNQLDIVLKTEIVEHFKNENETIATIQICKVLGDFFINHWKLNYNTKFNFNNSITFEDTPSTFLNYYSNLGLSNPYLIMRVVFSCYHKKLNNKEFSESNEIDLINKEFNSSECNVESFEHYSTAKSRINFYEDSILFRNKLMRYYKDDVLGKRYYEEKRKSSFYISGCINKIDLTNNLITLQIVDIVSDKRYRSVYYNDELLNIGDTINVDFGEWYKYNDSIFNYRNGNYEISMPNWNEYIKSKYYEN